MCCGECGFVSKLENRRFRGTRRGGEYRNSPVNTRPRWGVILYFILSERSNRRSNNEDTSILPSQEVVVFEDSSLSCLVACLVVTFLLFIQSVVLKSKNGGLDGICGGRLATSPLASA